MLSSTVRAFKILIPLFAERPPHPVVPLGRRTAGARSAGQGRPPAGALRAPLTAASTLAGWRCREDRALFRYAVVVVVVAVSLSSGFGVAIAQSVPGAPPAVADPYAAHIAEASRRFGIPERWIRAVLRAESAGDVRAISSAGAIGLMQVMPDTWAELRIRYGLGRNPYDPRDSILAGTAYLREMWDRYGDMAAMLAAYNAGPARYDEHRATARPLPAETRAYVASLAPALYGECPSKIASAIALPIDWREAAIFVVHDDGTQAVDLVSPDRAPNDARSLAPARTEALTAAQPEGLFIARNANGGRR
ncbi:lytic transglycosylase domain-containing protein [Rhizobium lentis]|uniref:lytic transglycosylase domain-containing protein n=1 Tax=Rhizobium lentis TaxID=1138194 RepID=UPI001C834D00|nr:lytic transglycosylase domain-containing protein [Rhizobium lentis]MBX5086751.1 lytic transglycosylase domain-containing protein [Rhizobium lentis]MBX5099396.1 lytic transglycosylase domain-containing protein [Rhizobium lentis]MBX5124313.1 lytic transglycosylase domain-containing protein [Rhizobium lentis]